MSEAGVRVFRSEHRFVHFYMPNSTPVSIFLFHFAPFYHGQNTERLIFEHAVGSSSCHQNLLPTPQKCVAQSYNLSAHTGPYTSLPPVLLTYIYTNIPTSRDSRRVTSVCVSSLVFIKSPDSWLEPVMMERGEAGLHTQEQMLQLRSAVMSQVGPPSPVPPFFKPQSKTMARWERNRQQ